MAWRVMRELGFAIFETAIGDCGIAWNERALVAAHLPEDSREAMRSRMRRRFPDAAEIACPPRVALAIEAIRALLRGEKRDLAEIELDMSGTPEFHRRVYDIARKIPPGQVLTYGEIAARLGEPGLARAVGQALGHNPFAIVVPCHRVVAAGGKSGGFSARGGAATKRRLLEIEGAVEPARDLFGETRSIRSS